VPTAPTPAELDRYRERADRFIAELDEEYYLHFAGLKDTFELEPIYERYSDLTQLEQAQAIGLAVDGGARTRELWRFACEGYLGNLTREHTERIARLEAELQANVNGDTVPYRMLRPTIANEPDRNRRQRLDRVRCELGEEHLNPIYLDGARTTASAVPELGSRDYVELYRRFAFQLDDLAEQCRSLLGSTEQLYEEAMDRALRARLGIGLAEARRWDIPRLFRAPTWDDAFPADKMVPALEATLADLGIDLRRQENVHLDLEQRPQKTPRAFCAPIEVPDRIMLVIQPIGGPDDWRALFHEAGHTEHFAHTSPQLAMEEKRLGDNAVTEGWAMLLQHLTDEPAWLNRRLDFPRPNEFAEEGATGLLYFVRRYCAKLLYELEFHSATDPTEMQSRYVELLGGALKIEPSETDYLADIDSGFYVNAYLRSWAFEAQLRDFLREQFGTDWFAKRDAGSLLRELWSEGQRLNADDLLKEVTGATLEMEAVADRVREAIPR
jgi:oligoendopeptidase F